MSKTRLSEASQKEDEKNIAENDVRVLLTNRKGAYALFSNKPSSRYEGVFFRMNSGMVKVIESFVFQKEVTDITNRLWCVSLKRGELAQTVFMPLHHDALVVELSEPAEFDLVLDVKIAEDNRVWGRNYEVLREDHALLITFSKKNDGRDDNTTQNQEFEVFLALYAQTLEFLPLQRWEEHRYAADEERHSPPFTRWVFNACRVRAKDFVCAWSTKKSDAISMAKKVFEDRERLKFEREAHVHAVIAKIPKIKNAEVSLAYQCARVALDALRVNDHSLSAGLPWFYQCWARDEIISTKAFMLQKNHAYAKTVLQKYFSNITSEGLLPNMVGRETDLLAIDAVGWLFLRWKELIDASAKTRSPEVSKREKERIAELLKTTLSSLMTNRFSNGLIQAKSKETWMDTEYGGDTRAGAPIEVQAQVLCMMKILRKLTGKKDPSEDQLVETVRKKFLKGNMMMDVAGQPTIRPNIFIAAYVYPELLSDKEWDDCFDSVLQRVWLPWGGVTSIDKKSSLFSDVYTGEDNKSYHRGDSWFWLNNLAAIVMHRVNPKKFKAHIAKILEASTTEILYKGATGFAGELSSAKELSSKGCCAQAWSNALFIELVHELLEDLS